MTKKQMPVAVPAVGFSIMSAEDKVARARTWLLRNRPMWGSLLMRLKVREHRGTRTQSMITDGRVVEWARPYVDSMSVEETIAVLAHEVGHCMLKHVFRQGGRDHEAWEESADHVINLLLVEDHFELPGDPPLDAQFKGMSAEQVYPIILAQHEQKRKEQQQQEEDDAAECSQSGAGKGKSKGKPKPDQEQEKQEPQKSMGEMAEPGTLGSPDEQNEPTEEEKAEKEKQKKEKQKSKPKPEKEKSDEALPGDPGKEEGEEEGDGDTQADGDSTGEPDEGEPEQGEGGESGQAEEQSEPQALSEAEQSELEADWSQAAAAAAQQAVQRGHGSRNMQREVLQSAKQPISFEDYIKYFLQRCTDRSQQTWRRQSRRSIATDIYLPGRRGQHTGALVAIIDTSGSIDAKALATFIANVQGAQADLRPSMIICLYADDEVMNEVRYGHGEMFEVRQGEAKGGGGTDFRPAFKRVVELRDEENIDIAGVLYLTDLEGDMPKAEDALRDDYPPTLWCFDSSGCYSREEHEALVKQVTFGEVAEIQTARKQST